MEHGNEVKVTKFLQYFYVKFGNYFVIFGQVKNIRANIYSPLKLFSSPKGIRAYYAEVCVTICLWCPFSQLYSAKATRIFNFLSLYT